MLVCTVGNFLYAAGIGAGLMLALILGLAYWFESRKKNKNKA